MQEMPIQIMVVGYKGGTTMVNLPNLTAPIDMLFDEYTERTGVPLGSLRLLYGTKDLRYGANKTLADFGMGNLANVFAVMRLPGGINPLQLLRSKKQELKELPGFITVTTTEPCMVTLDDDLSTKRAKMPCGHVISPVGMTQYCKSLLDAKRFTFPCPYVGTHGEHCTATWEFLLVKYVCVLDQAELETIERQLNENYTRRSIGVQQCPGCQTFCSRINSHDRVVRCIVCSKRGGAYDFCWSCLQPTCSSYHCYNPWCDGHDPRLRFLQVCPKKEVVKVPNCPSVRACVQCGILIEHTAACKHMMCIACQTEFCFICLKKRVDGKWQCGSYNSQCKPAPVQTQIHGQ